MAERQPREALDNASNASNDSSNSNSNSNNVEAPVSSPRFDVNRSSSLREVPGRLSRVPPPKHQHRHSHSLSETLRANPASPRSRRQPSLTQIAIQSLIDNPPVRNAPDPAFAGRDWRQICVGELVSPNDLKFVELDTGIEEATNVRWNSDLSLSLSWLFADNV